MKVSAVNLNKLTFKNNQEVEDKKEVNGQHSDEKKSGKVVSYTLIGLAVLGGAIILLNNMKKGKTPTVEPDIDLSPSVLTDDNIPLSKDILSEDAKRELKRVKALLNPKNNSIVDEEFVDKNILVATAEHNLGLKRLNEWYRSLELKSDEIIAEGQDLKNKYRRILAPKKGIDPELGNKIDADLASRVMDPKTRAEMAEQYTKDAQDAADAAAELAAKEAKKAQMLKLKEENPEEYARLKKERELAKKAAKTSAKADAISNSIKRFEMPDGREVYSVSVPIKNGKYSQIRTVDSDKVLSSTIVENDRTIHTVFNDDIKTVYIHENKTPCSAEIEVIKTYRKCENGKYEFVSRQIDDSNREFVKTVTRLDNGNTQITTETSKRIEIVVRDKKGEVLETKIIHKFSGSNPEPPVAPVKVLASWYVNYLDLCKKYGQAPRICGVKGGAWDHFYELSLRENDPQAYEFYISTRNYRARYNETARLLLMLEKLDLGSLSPKNLSKYDVILLKNYLNNPSIEPAAARQINNLLAEYEAFVQRAAAEEKNRHRATQRAGQKVLLNA